MSIRNPGKKNRVSGKSKVTLSEKQCDQYPAISYRYMTTNKQYSLKDKCEPIALAHALFFEKIKACKNSGNHFLQFIYSLFGLNLL